MPFLSVIVPIYNAEKYLKECIDSIIKQTFKDYELILVNDGSTDSSLQICDWYCKHNDHVKLINQENKGLVSARKAGINVATGEYIAWVDSDDAMMEDMLEKMCNEAKKTDADMIICDMYSWNGDKLIPLEQALDGGLYEGDRLEREFYRKMLYAGNFYTFGILPAQFNKITKLEIIKTNMLDVDEDIIIGEDAACTYFCMLDCKKISYLKGEYLYKYRANLGSMCFTWNSKKITSAETLLPFFYNKLCKYDKVEVMETFWYYFAMIYSNVYFEYGIYAISENNKDVLLKQKIQLPQNIYEESLKHINKEFSMLPFDRKIFMKDILNKEGKIGILAKMILKIRCILMYVYRKSEIKRNNK